MGALKDNLQDSFRELIVQYLEENGIHKEKDGSLLISKTMISSIVRSFNYVINGVVIDVVVNDMEYMTNTIVKEVFRNCFKLSVNFEKLRFIKFEEEESWSDGKYFYFMIKFVSNDGRTLELFNARVVLSEEDKLIKKDMYKGKYTIDEWELTMKTYKEIASLIKSKLYELFDASRNQKYEPLVNLDLFNMRECKEKRNGYCNQCKKYLCKLEEERKEKERKAMEIEREIERKKKAKEEEQKLIKRFKGVSLYFFHCKELARIKIGISKNPIKRKRTISTALALDLEILNIWPECGIQEKEIHKKFDDKRIKGEWFEDCQAIRDFMMTNENGLKPEFQ